MSNTYVYKLGDAHYINLTNACTNDCTFCLRNEYCGVGGYDLRLSREPDAADIIAAFEKLPDVRRAVFCGLGEPTMRLDALLGVARYLKSRGVEVRLNTNGQGSAFAGEDIAPRLKGLVDVVSVSLNASNAAEYDRLCRSAYGEAGYQHMLDFARSCAAQGIETVLSVVDLIGAEEIEKCRRIAGDIGAKLRVRSYIE
jgi:TatD family-associated radical SAM protein